MVDGDSCVYSDLYNVVYKISGMKTIKEIIREYIRSVNVVDIEDAVRFGVEFAQKMIPIEDELPTELFIVLLYNKENVWVTGHYYNGKFTNISNGDEEEVTHWRPIFVL